VRFQSGHDGLPRFLFGPDGLQTDTSKIRVIRDWSTPRNAKDVQSFLGLANPDRRFIAWYPGVTVPLTRLTRKDAPWVWSLQCDDAFQLLKTAFTSAPILRHFDPSLPPVVETDASDYAIASILSVRTEDGQIPPVACFSRTLSGAELNYDTHDKELLAIFEAFKIWRHYPVTSHTSEVITNHKNLEYFSSTKMPTRRQARWLGFLSALVWLFALGPGNSVRNQILILNERISTLKGGRGLYVSEPAKNCAPSSRKNNSLLRSAPLSCATS